jgi:hypothetical protein
MHLLTDPPTALTDDDAQIGAALDALPIGAPAIIAGDSESDLAQTIRRLASYRSCAVRFVAPLPLPALPSLPVESDPVGVSAD